MSKLAVQAVTNKVASISLVTLSALTVPSNSSVSCMESVAAGTLIADVLTSYGTSSSTPSLVTCDGVQWTVGVCASAVSICTDCRSETSSAAIHSLSPCSQATNCLANSLIPNFIEGIIHALVVAFKPPTLAPTIHAITAIAGPDSIQAAVVLSADGFVSCAALSKIPTTLQTILLASTPTSWTTGNSTHVTIASLTSSTDYKLYCISASAAGTQSSLASALSTSVPVSTLCCKKLLVSSALKSASTNQMMPNVLQVSVDALPTSALTVTVSAQQYGREGALAHRLNCSAVP